MFRDLTSWLFCFWPVVRQKPLESKTTSLMARERKRRRERGQGFAIDFEAFSDPKVSHKVLSLKGSSTFNSVALSKLKQSLATWALEGHCTRILLQGSHASSALRVQNLRRSGIIRAVGWEGHPQLKFLPCPLCTSCSAGGFPSPSHP